MPLASHCDCNIIQCIAGQHREAHSNVTCQRKAYKSVAQQREECFKVAQERKAYKSAAQQRKAHNRVYHNKNYPIIMHHKKYE